MMTVGMTSNQSGRGARYVAIRGVFPLREQLVLYAKAVNELGGNVASHQMTGFQALKLETFTAGCAAIAVHLSPL